MSLETSLLSEVGVSRGREKEGMPSISTKMYVRSCIFDKGRGRQR